MINLYKGDCLIEMNKIKDKSVDMILADLPYGATVCKWDIVIPFEPLWQHYKRIIKDDGVVILFGTEPFSSYLRMSCMELYKYDWIWKKNKITGYPHAKNMPLRDYENLSVFSKGSINHSNLTKNRMRYYPQNLIYKPQTVKGKKNNSIISGRPSDKDYYVKEYTNYPKMHLVFNSEGNNFHPTQKPVALLEYLIKTYTNEGDTVLDNVMGSGSTGVACVNTNRNFIGIEMDEKYFEIAENRINEKLKEREMENEGN